MKRFFLLVPVLIVSLANAATVKLAWDPSPTSSVGGYRLRALDANGNLARSLDAGPALTGSFSDLVGGEKYWFSVVAYNAAVESRPSNTVEWLAPTQSAVRINCGGASYTDKAGQRWSADKSFVGGTAKTYSQFVSGTNDSALYQSARFARALIYEIPVANGNYQITLHFAEMYWSAPGKRVFSIALEGQTVLPNFDIYSLTGRYVAVKRSFTASVADGVVNIVCTATADNAMLSAIEIKR